MDEKFEKICVEGKIMSLTDDLGRYVLIVHVNTPKEPQKAQYVQKKTDYPDLKDYHDDETRYSTAHKAWEYDMSQHSKLRLGDITITQLI